MKGIEGSVKKLRQKIRKKNTKEKLKKYRGKKTSFRVKDMKKDKQKNKIPLKVWFGLVLWHVNAKLIFMYINSSISNNSG